jgi:2,4-dienoyl-CoA reductase-like NADH-dependent reductase (Old Yellow Enzyme family)
MSILFESKQIGSMSVKNRLIRAATSEKMATPDGCCTPKLLRLYTRLAKGGVGMILTGGAYVQRNGKGIPNIIGLHRDDTVAGYKQLTDRVHAYDVKIVVQLMHCGRQGPVEVVGETPIAPSAVPNLLGVTPIAMSAGQVAQTIDNFIRAAKRARHAGFDGVQIHAAHGYLIHEFLSPRTNRRRDRWGGNFEKRLRFLKEIYQGIRKQLGSDYPILIKLNIDDYLKDGIGAEAAGRIMESVSSMGFDAIEISAGTWESHFYMSRGDIPKNYWLYTRAKGEEKKRIADDLGRMAKAVRFKEAYLSAYAKDIRSKIHCPLILVGGLRAVAKMEKILKDGVADFISLCRPLIRNPEFPNLIQRGVERRSSCINCNLCLTDKPVACYQMRYRPPHF